jgi:hypothetical protein
MKLGYLARYAAVAAVVTMPLCRSSDGAAFVIVDFEQIQEPDPFDPFGLLLVPTPYDEDGIRLTTGGALQSPRPGTTHFAGSIGVFNDTEHSRSYMRSIDGRRFTPLSVDLARVTDDSDVAIHFTGTKSDGSEVFASFERGQFSPLQFTSSLFSSSFDRLKELSWISTSDVQFTNAMQVDQFLFEIIPEPSAFAIAATSLFALSAIRRRR